LVASSLCCILANLGSISPTCRPSLANRLYLHAHTGPHSRALVPLPPPPPLRLLSTTEQRNCTKRTISNSLHAESLGCAPTPSQYFARDTSSSTALNARPSPSCGCCGSGLYVPRTSSGFELRAVLWDGEIGGQRSIGWKILRCQLWCDGYGARGKNVPCVRDDNVVEWVVALAEAGEADTDYHCWRGVRVGSAF
jgi:hypothetical protein